MAETDVLPVGLPVDLTADDVVTEAPNSAPQATRRGQKGGKKVRGGKDKSAKTKVTPTAEPTPTPPKEPPAKAHPAKAKTPTVAKSKRPNHTEYLRAAFLLKQASEPTRLQILLLLADGEKHVGVLCAEFNQSQPATSSHLALLRHGGLIQPRRSGKNQIYSLTESGQRLAEIVKMVMPKS